MGVADHHRKVAQRRVEQRIRRQIHAVGVERDVTAAAFAQQFVGRQTDMRFHPQAVPVDQADRHDRRLADGLGKADDPVESRIRWGVEDLQVVQRRQPMLLVVRHIHLLVYFRHSL